MNAALNASLNYISPGNTVSAITMLTCVSPYTSVSQGTIDVPAATADNTTFPVSFGSVGSATLIYIVNKTEAAIGVRLQGAVADQFEIAPLGFLLQAMPDNVATPIDEIVVVTTALQVAAGTVEFVIVGDPA